MSLRIQPHLFRRSSISVDRFVTSRHDFNLKYRSREFLRFCDLQGLVALSSCQKLAEIFESSKTKRIVTLKFTSVRSWRVDFCCQNSRWTQSARSIC